MRFFTETVVGPSEPDSEPLPLLRCEYGEVKATRGVIYIQEYQLCSQRYVILTFAKI